MQFKLIIVNNKLCLEKAKLNIQNRYILIIIILIKFKYIDERKYYILVKKKKIFILFY